MEPCFLTAAEAGALIAARKLSCEELMRSCLARIEAREPVVRAWLHLDPELAIRRARELDKRKPKSALHGVPFGVKDVIDTKDLTTTHNSPIYPDVRAGRDASCVSVLCQFGALMLGKTDTVEFAAGGRLALTTNPHNPAHTPGGSSSGSGAAVADWMVPLALGTQTGGSVTRPASFNGVYGLKPTYGLVSTEGVRHYAHSLDTVGWFGRCAADLALVARMFRLIETEELPAVEVRGLKVGLCRTPVWEQADAASRDTFFAAAKRLETAGAQVRDLELPASFAGLPEAQKLVMNDEGRASFLPEYLSAYDLLAPDLRAKVESAMGITPGMLAASYTLADSCRPQFDALFGDELDVVLAPAARGEAPLGLHSTGDAIFSGLWTLLHVPSVAIPGARGPQNLPVGIQILGPRFADARLLSIAAAVAPVIDVETKTPVVDSKRSDAPRPDAKRRAVDRFSGSAAR